MFAGLWSNVSQKSAPALLGRCPRSPRLSVHSAHQRTPREGSHSDAFPASASLPRFWLGTSSGPLLFQLHSTSHKFYISGPKPSVKNWEESLRLYEPQSTNTLSHGGGMRVPLSSSGLKGTAHVPQCGQASQCGSRQLGGSSTAYCSPHFAQSTPLHTAAPRRLSPSVTTAHCVQLTSHPNWNFREILLTKRMCCQVMLGKTFSTEYPATGCRFC